MAPDVYLNRIACAPGEVVRTVEASCAAGLTRTDARTFLKSGFATHRTCAEGSGAYELARRAVEGLEADLSGVDALLYATALPCNANLASPEVFAQSRDVKDLADFPASRLQADLGLGGSVVGLTQQACTSMLGALRLARALLIAEPDLARLLCVTADAFPPGALYEQAYNLVSDGASAAIVSREPVGYKILACHAVTNGALARASDDEMAGSHLGFSHRVITDALARANLPTAKLDWIVPQNTNPKVWAVLARLLGVDPDRVFLETVGEVGHMISSDNLYNLERLEALGRIRTGDTLLLYMASFGMNWQTVLLEKVS